MLLANGRQPGLYVRRVSPHATLLCAGEKLCPKEKLCSNHAYIRNGLIFFFASFKLRAAWPKKSLHPHPDIFSRQNTSEPIGKMRNKESETLYPVSMALCVSQRPGPIIHSSFPYLSLHRMKDKQKPKSSWLAWCFCLKALLLSQPLTSSSAHKSPALTIHYLPDSMLLFLLSLYLFSPFLYLYKNKALLMTVGSQGPAGARVLESAARWKGGHLLLLFLLFYHRWE